MRIYITKNNKGAILYFESLWQSIVSDTISVLALGAIVSVNRVVSHCYNMQPSVIFDLLFVALVFMYLGAKFKKFRNVKNDEVVGIIQEFMDKRVLQKWEIKK